MGRSASACSFGWPNKCYNAECIWPTRLRAAGLIITAELARQRTVEAAVGQEDDWIRIQGFMKPSVCTVYLIKIHVCVICVMVYTLSQALDGNSICEAVGKRERDFWKSSKEGLTYYIMLCCELQSNFLFILLS